MKHLLFFVSDRAQEDTALPEDCLSAISPVVDILVLARFQNICVLACKCKLFFLNSKTAGESLGKDMYLPLG